MGFIKGLGELLIGILIGAGAILMVGGVLFIGAIGAVAIGWLTGVFVNWVFGGLVVSGINLLLGTAITTGSLPTITAALGFIAYIARGGNAKNVAQLSKDKVEKNAKK